MPPDEQSPPSWLSSSQRTLAAAAVGALSITALALFLFALFKLFQAFVTTFSGVLWPLAAAAILALILRPITGWFENRLKLSRLASIVCLYVLVIIVATGISLLVVPTLIAQLVQLAKELPEVFQNIREFAERRFPEVAAWVNDNFGETAMDDAKQAVADNAQQLLGALLPAIEQFGGWLASMFATAAGLSIIPVYLFFFLKTDRDPTADLKDQLSFVREEWRDDALFLAREFGRSIVAFFRGQILIGLIDGILLAIGFTAIGLNFGILIGLFFGVVNIIPYLGTIMGLGIALPLAYFQPEGSWILVALVIAVFAIVQTIEAWVLQPKILGKETGLPALAVIIAIFFWGVALDGILGMILAIPLTAFLVVAWRLARRKYFARWGIFGQPASSNDAQPNAADSNPTQRPQAARG